MSNDISKIGRKILGIVAAIICYYVVHEGAHLVYALCTGVFENVVFMFPGVQILANVELLTRTQLFVFNLVGVVSTLAASYVLTGLSGRIEKVKSNAIRAIFYYTTIVLLMCDAIYLSVLCGFFGGGDMNGISLLVPEVLARLLFGAIGIINVIVILKVVVPAYARAFELHNKGKA